MAGKITDIRSLTPRDVTKRQVVSYETSSLFGSPNRERYNPDDLASRKGLGIYRRMLDDEQVKAVVEFRMASITARGYEFKYPEDSPLAEGERLQRAAFFERCVTGLRGSFDDALHTILRGHVYGFSMTEKVYDAIEHEGKQKLAVVQLLARDPAWFRFFTDDYGTLLRVEQHIGNNKTEVDPAKFVHYVRQPADDRYYGRSDLRAAYRAWYAKGATITLYTTYLERFAGGFAWAELPPESSIGEGHADYTALQDALRDIRNLSSLILPPGVKLNVLQPGSTAEYRAALTYFDLSIAKALLVPNLLGLSDNGGAGSLAQSQTHLDAYFMTTAADSRRLEDALNEQLFRDLGDLNWGDGLYPRFCFKPASQEHVKWMVDTFLALAGGGALQPTEADEAHLRKLLNFPARAEGDALLAEEQIEIDGKRMEQEAKFAPKPAVAQFTRQDIADAVREVLSTHHFHTPGGHEHDQQRHTGDDARDDAVERWGSSKLPQEGQQVRVRTKRIRGYGDIGVVKSVTESGYVTVRMYQSNALLGRERVYHESDLEPNEDFDVAPEDEEFVRRHGRPRSVDEVTFARMVDRVDFALIERRSEAATATASGELARLVARAAKRRLDGERVAELLANPEAIAGLAFDGADVGRIKGGFKEALGAAWAIGADSAKRELAKAKGPVPATFATLRDTAAGYFEANGFRMAANLTDGMKAIIMQELLQAVKGGLRPEQVVALIYQRLIMKGFTTLAAIEVEEPRTDILVRLTELLQDALDTANVPAYLNTLVRTNTFEALNEARFAVFEESAKDGFVVGYEYSALLDDNTTEICRALDDGVWAAGSEVWDTYRPPNHYNCRSLLVPVTVLDGWDGVESPAPTVEPQEGFK